VNRPENQVQSAIVHFLRVAVPDHVTFAIPNASVRTRTGRPGNAVPGLLPGIPDLCLLGPLGRAYFIECKAGYGDLSEVQFAMRNRFEAMGVPFAIARSIDDVRTALGYWKIKTKEAA
jgi:hypothetical protein